MTFQTAGSAAVRVKADQSIAFAPVADTTFGAPAPVLAATASSGLAVKLASQTPEVCTVSGATAALKDAGTCTIRATQAGNAGYNAAPPVDRSFSIAPAAATVTLSGLDRIYSARQMSATCATTPNGLKKAATYSEAGSGLERINAGTYGVTCVVTQRGYAGSAGGTLTIAKKDQKISFPAIAKKTVGDAPFAVTAKASSGLPVSVASLTPGVCTVAGGVATLTVAGTCTVRASQPGDGNHAPAADVERSFRIRPSVTLTKLTQVYDGTQKSAGCETTPAGLPTAITYKNAGSGTGRINAGSYWVTCTVKDPVLRASATGTLVIAQADQTIAFDAIDGKTVGDAPFDVAVSASSGLAVSLASRTPEVCTVVGTTVTLAHDGVCTLEAGQLGDVNHKAAPSVDQSFAVAPAVSPLNYLVAYDSALQDDWSLAIWEDSSHRVTANPDAPAPGGRPGNAIDVQFSVNGYGAFGLANMRDWNNVHYMYLNEFKTIEFDLFVDPDTTGLENLVFILEDATYSNQPPLVNYIPGWDPAHPETSYGRWMHVSIDLSQVGATIPRFARFLFWNGAGDSRPHFHMANVRLGWQDDPTPAVITLQSVTPGLTYNTLALAFTTDKDAIYKVEYGIGDYAGVITGNPNAWQRNHAVTLTGLSRGHTYQYRITVWNHHMDPEAPPTPTVLLGSYTMPAVPTAPPVVSTFTATPGEIAVGMTARLAWSAVDYDTLSIDQGVGVVSLVPGATGVLVSPSAPTTYTITATNGIGSVTRTVSIVTHDVPGVSGFTATPRKINAGETTTLTWNAGDFNAISIDHGVGDVTSVPGATGVVVSPAETTTYVLTASNAYGTVRQTATVTIASADTNPVWVMGYYVGYHRAIQRPDQIDYSTMTHVIVGAAVPGLDGSLDTSFYTGGEASGHAWALETVQRAHAAGTKALLMLGGAGAIAGFEATSDPLVRAAFVANVKAFVDECGFDGVDLDWEPIDVAADGQIVLALLEALQAPGALPRSSFTYTLPVGWNNKNFDPMADPFYGTVSAYFDRVSTMSYSMLWIGDGWETWHSSPLYGQTDNAPSSIDDTVRALRAAGVPNEKIGIGIGFYGTAYENGGWSSSAGAYVHQNPPDIPAYATAPHQSTAHVFGRYGDNQLSYSNIMRGIYSATAYRWDESARVPYLSWETPRIVNNPEFGISDMQTTYLTYDDEQGIAEKGAYVRKNGLGGVMIWAISEGYLGSWKTTGELDPLMKAVWLAFKR